MTEYTRKIPLKQLTTHPSIIKRIEELVSDTDHIIRETYQFIRLYVLHLWETNQPIPIINRSFIKMVYKVVSIPTTKGGKKNPNLLTINTFYKEHYEPLQTVKVQAVPKDILDREATTIETAINNHIIGSFFTYINRFVYSLSDDKIQRKNIRNDLYSLSNLKKKVKEKTKKPEKNNLNSDVKNINDVTLTSDHIFHDRIKKYITLISNNLEILHKNPQACLPLLIMLSHDIQMAGKKQLAIIPLRRSLIPSYIQLDSSNVVIAFKTILEKEKIDLWANIQEIVRSTLKCKDDRYLFSSMRTDGVGCSILFTATKKYQKGVSTKKDKSTEQYFEDLKKYDEFKNSRIVGIDPNKGNLVYCTDGENVLRYTQDERRLVSKKNKYRKIRNSYAKQQGQLEDLEKDLELLQHYNSRACDTKNFKEYLLAKNIFSKKYTGLYSGELYRKLKFNSYINLKRSEDKFINRFKAMYGIEDVVIIYGDWDERPGFLKGKEPTKGKSMRRLLRKAGYKVYLLDEFRTSKLCHCCGKENESNYVKRKHPKPWKRDINQDVWGLLRCKNEHCRRVHNRDFNSSSNIRSIAIHVLETGERPVLFRRTPQASASVDD